MVTRLASGQLVGEDWAQHLQNCVVAWEYHFTSQAKMTISTHVGFHLALVVKLANSHLSWSYITIQQLLTCHYTAIHPFPATTAILQSIPSLPPTTTHSFPATTLQFTSYLPPHPNTVLHFSPATTPHHSMYCPPPFPCCNTAIYLLPARASGKASKLEQTVMPSCRAATVCSTRGFMHRNINVCPRSWKSSTMPLMPWK